jgi:hypothetical protein
MILFQAGPARLQFDDTGIPGGLDLDDLGVDDRGLLAFRDADLIFQPFQRLLAGILVHIRDDILGKVQDPVQVAP